MKKLRDELGLTQQEIGNLIGMNRTGVNMYEKRKRSLSSKQLTVLSDIELLLLHGSESSANAYEKIVLNEQEAAVIIIKELTDTIKQSSYKLLLLKNKLKVLEEDYFKAQNLWKLIPGLKIKYQEDKLRTSYLNLLEVECQEKLNKFGVYQQATLRYKILSLEKEIESAQIIIDEVSPLSQPFIEGI